MRLLCENISSVSVSFATRLFAFQMRDYIIFHEAILPPLGNYEIF